MSSNPVYEMLLMSSNPVYEMLLMSSNPVLLPDRLMKCRLVGWLLPFQQKSNYCLMGGLDVPF
jgi:hypothetical protein